MGLIYFSFKTENVLWTELTRPVSKWSFQTWNIHQKVLSKIRRKKYILFFLFFFYQKIKLIRNETF